MSKKSFFISLTVLFSFLLLSACSKDKDDIEQMPSALFVGDEIVLSQSSPMQFGLFRVTGSGKGQWADRKVDDISASFSDATYVYTVTGENTATLSSVNTQYRTGRMWSVDLYLTFDTPTSGNFVLKDKSLDSGVSYTTHGTFILE